MRIGSGWDLHRLVMNRPLILGGVTIPSAFGEEAHSDGDVLTHAIIDALFGAVADGDIGSHFPDNDPEYQDISSMVLLRRAMASIRDYEISNIDCTVLLDNPKLRPYISWIKDSLSEVMGIDTDQLSIKAKTSEGTRSQSIEAQATVLLMDKKD